MKPTKRVSRATSVAAVVLLGVAGLGAQVAHGAGKGGYAAALMHPKSTANRHLIAGIASSSTRHAHLPVTNGATHAGLAYLLQIPWSRWPGAKSAAGGPVTSAEAADNKSANIFAYFHARGYSALGMQTGYYQHAVLPIASRGLGVFWLGSSYRSARGAGAMFGDAMKGVAAQGMTVSKCQGPFPPNCADVTFNGKDNNGVEWSYMYMVWAQGKVVAELVFGVPLATLNAHTNAADNDVTAIVSAAHDTALSASRAK